MSRFATHLWPVGLLLLAGSACQPAAEITTYTAERTAPPRPVFEAAQVASQLDRIWAAMLPLDETAWFFKVSGPAERVTAHRAEFQEFLASLGKGPSAEKPLSWKLPVGWTEKGPSEMRLATLVIPDDEQDLELAVSSLPLGSEWEDFVAVNVNRWLGQLSQTDLPKSTILQQTTQADTPAGPVSVIELAGILKKLPGMNPHAGMAGGPAPVAATAAQPPAPSKAGFKFTAPESWQPGQTSSMRKAAFNIGSGDERAEVTVIALPSSAERKSPMCRQTSCGGRAKWGCLRTPTSKNSSRKRQSVAIKEVCGGWRVRREPTLDWACWLPWSNRETKCGSSRCSEPPLRGLRVVEFPVIFSHPFALSRPRQVVR